MRFGIAFPHPVVPTKRRDTTHGGLLQISSVHGNEQIADGHLFEDMTLAYWGFSRLAHLFLVGETKLIVLVKEK